MTPAGRRLVAWAPLVLALVAGLVLRVWILRSPFGHLDSDEAVCGLQARAFLDGHLDVFYWGQAYGGTLETGLVAGLFAMVGSGVLALKAVPIVLHAVACVLVWRVGRALGNDAAGRAAGALFWVFPPAFLLSSTKARTFYATGLVASVAIVLLAVRVDREPRPRLALGLGLAIGLGWWTTPHVGLVALPVLAWLAARRWRSWTLAGPLALGVVVGAAPWILYNLTHGWASIAEASAPTGSPYLERTWKFAQQAVPAVFGARMSYSGTWIAGPLSWLLLAVGLAAFLVRRRPFADPLLVTFVAYGLLLMLITTSLEEPRYAVFVAWIPLLVLARFLVHPAALAAAVAVAVALSIPAFSDLLRFSERYPDNYNLTAGDLAPALAAMRSTRVSRTYADYWASYRVSFESGERIIATPVLGDSVRYGPHDREVEGSARPAYLMFRGTVPDVRLRRAFADLGVSFERVVAGRFALYLPDRRVARGEVEAAIRP